jgi:hypothetical protein
MVIGLLMDKMVMDGSSSKPENSTFGWISF